MGTFFTDIKRYKAYDNRNVIIHLLTQRSLWAIFQFRVANSVYRSRLPHILKRPLLFIFSGWKLGIEILTGISIPYSCQIGKGLYLGHAGNIVFNGQSKIGEYCNISQGVTIGVSGRHDRRGVPVIGNRVYIGANAVVSGKITIGDYSVIGANSSVVRDVVEGTTVMGVPALKISDKNSDDYILPLE